MELIGLVKDIYLTQQITVRQITLLVPDMQEDMVCIVPAHQQVAVDGIRVILAHHLIQQFVVLVEVVVVHHISDLELKDLCFQVMIH